MAYGSVSLEKRIKNNIKNYSLGQLLDLPIVQKELEILRDLVDGIAIKEIAIKRDLSERTVKYHITNMLQKTGYKTSMQLVVDVVNQKLIVPEF